MNSNPKLHFEKLNDFETMEILQSKDTATVISKAGQNGKVYTVIVLSQLYKDHTWKQYNQVTLKISQHFK